MREQQPSTLELKCIKPRSALDKLFSPLIIAGMKSARRTGGPNERLKIARSGHARSAIAGSGCKRKRDKGVSAFFPRSKYGSPS